MKIVRCLNNTVRLKTTVLAGLFLLLFQLLCAQEKQYFFSSFDKADGLSHNHVIYFLRDSKGFMWIGTVDGLCRFDGYSFKVYKNDPADTTSLKSNIISRLFEDNLGNIWVGTGDNFDIFNPETETFLHQQSLFNNRIQVPVSSKWYHGYDKSGNILYANTVTGIYKYIVSSDSVVRINFPYNGSDRLITGIDADKSDNIWIICSNAYLYKISTSSYTTVDSVKIPWRQNSNYHFIIDKGDDIWLFDKNNASGAVFYNTATRNMQFLSTQSDRGRLSSNELRSIVEDDDGMIWIGTDHGGINIVNKKDFSVAVILHDPSENRSLCDNSITRLYNDRQGFVWAGTFKRGFSCYHKSQYLFTSYKVVPEVGNTSGFNDINNFVEDGLGNIWIGTNGGGLFYYNRSKNTYRQYIHNPNDPSSISANVIIGLKLDRKDRLWIGTYFGGLNLFEGNKFRHFKNDPSDPSTLSDDRIWDICEDTGGLLWVATLMGGLNIFDPEKEKVIARIPIERDTTIRTGAVFTIIKGSGNTMWFSTANGLRSYDQNTQKTEFYFPDKNNPQSLSNGLVYDVYADSRGFIWAATYAGLNKLDLSTGKFRVFKQEDGLSSNLILKIIEDNNHNLWMNTSSGISNLIITRNEEYHTMSYVFRNYDESDGLQGNEFNEKAILKTRAGELFFGGPNGFNIIEPDNIRIQNIRSSVVFTDFQLFNKSISHKELYNKRKILDRSITYSREIHLKHHENVFTIEFSSLNMLHPERRKYMYCLENFNNEWFIVESRNRRVTYTNLDPGKYVFRVKATLNDGTWDDQEAKLMIFIRPPWWDTLFVKLFGILFLASVVVGFYYFRLYQLNRQKKLLEIKVKQRTHELEEANIKLLQHQNELSVTNMELQESQEKILAQNKELEKHRNHLEQKVQERTNELQEALKMAMASDRLKSAFLANMSHEIRTPMNAIMGFSGMLADSTVSNEERMDFVKLIHSNSESLLQLINDILDLSMIEANQLAIKKEPFDLNELLKQVHSLYLKSNNNPQVEIKLNHTLINNQLVLNTDKNRLKQILYNLLSNACKFTRSGTIEIGTEKDSDTLRIYVKDTGIGIAAGDIKHLFERFRKLERDSAAWQTRGTGLGLAISKRLAELLGGNIEVVSEFGKGSVFTFAVLYSEVVTSEKIQPVPDWSPVSTKGSGKRILIVEDEEANYLYLKKILDKKKIIIDWVETGENAVSLYESGKYFDLILMDIKLTGMDGVEVLKKIRVLNSHQVVIAQTAYARAEDEVFFRKQGFDDYIAKPIDRKALFALLEKYL
jgi:signal transduction histidine kinase/ligand-binding sensor domain-containing protein/CheY-like chemotaxis protein